MTLLVLSDLLLSTLDEIGLELDFRTGLELDSWSMGEKFAIGRLMTPPELEDDLVRSTIGTSGLGDWIGVLVLDTLGAILRNFLGKGTAGAASFVDADNCLGCTRAFGCISLSDEEKDEHFLCLFILFSCYWLAGSLST